MDTRSSLQHDGRVGCCDGLLLLHLTSSWRRGPEQSRDDGAVGAGSHVAAMQFAGRASYFRSSGGCGCSAAEVAPLVTRFPAIRLPVRPVIPFHRSASVADVLTACSSPTACLHFYSLSFSPFLLKGCIQTLARSGIIFIARKLARHITHTHTLTHLKNQKRQNQKFHVLLSLAPASFFLLFLLSSFPLCVGMNRAKRRKGLQLHQAALKPGGSHGPRPHAYIQRPFR